MLKYNCVKKLFVKNSKINGSGLFANRSFKKGEFIEYIKGPTQRIDIYNMSKELAKKSLNWIGYSKEVWINTDHSPFRFINHSCDPSAAVLTKRKVYALRDINAGDEITMDYSLNDADHFWTINNCRCGAKNCRGTIRSIQHLDNKIFIKKRQLIQQVFQRVYKNSSYPH